MKKLLFFPIFIMVFCVKPTFAQFEVSLPIDFELSDNLFQIDSTYFTDFNGGTFNVLQNPFADNDNPSKWVGKIVRTGGDVWAGSKIQLDANLSFNQYPIISLKIYTASPVGTQVKLKIEDPAYLDLGDPSYEVDAWTTVSNGWETLVFDFSASPPTYNNIAFMFDYDVIGDGSTQSTFYFDDIMQSSSIDPNIIAGCLYPLACNYNDEATQDDGSCVFAQMFYDCAGFCVNDADNDLVCDELDNCSLVANFDQTDSDGDEEGDLCDYDDGLGISDLEQESSPLVKMIDLLGREQKHQKNGHILFYIYENGTVKKQFK